VSAAFWNGVIADHAASQIRATEAVTHRGWSINQGRWPEPAWSATSPDYDASWEGEEDGWVASGGHVNAPTRAALVEEIDAYIEEQDA
jgi:hypothetical protein